MERNEILEKMQVLFRETLGNDALVLTEETTADDVEEWTSLTHVQLITNVENTFHIKFSVREIMGWQNVGEIIDSIERKL